MYFTGCLTYIFPYLDSEDSEKLATSYNFLHMLFP